MQSCDYIFNAIYICVEFSLSAFALSDVGFYGCLCTYLCQNASKNKYDGATGGVSTGSKHEALICITSDSWPWMQSYLCWFFLHSAEWGSQWRLSAAWGTEPPPKHWGNISQLHNFLLNIWKTAPKALMYISTSQSWFCILSQPEGELVGDTVGHGSCDGQQLQQHSVEAQPLGALCPHQL